MNEPMSEMNSFHPTRRRAVLQAIGGTVALVAATAAVAADADPDAELLRLLAEMTALKREADALSEQSEDLPFEDPQRAKLSTRAAEIMLGWQERRRRVAVIPARTQAGLQAKARTAMELISRNGDGSPIDDEAMFWSVIRDVLSDPPAAERH